jgi:hypothetical protein
MEAVEKWMTTYKSELAAGASETEARNKADTITQEVADK